MGSETANDPEKTEKRPQLYFYDNHDLIIDKHRMLLPSEVRRCIVPERDGEAFFIIVGINKKPWFYTEQRYFEIAQQSEMDNLPGDDELAYVQMMFAQASRQPWDTQWRVGVPEKIRRKTGIGTVVTLAGVKDHLELWNREDWAAHEEELDKVRVEVFKRRKTNSLQGNQQVNAGTDQRSM
jgi:MraZ protein